MDIADSVSSFRSVPPSLPSLASIPERSTFTSLAHLFVCARGGRDAHVR